jgi:hypothetical protein
MAESTGRIAGAAAGQAASASAARNDDRDFKRGPPGSSREEFGAHWAERQTCFDQAPRAFDEAGKSRDFRGGSVKALANPGPIA